MKTNVIKREVETFSKSKTEFKISNKGSAKAKAFKILISGLYANKIQSVTREIWSNALDSHVMAGNPHVPFDISFPNVFEPNFRVRDFGIGMTHDEVLGLYTTLFESTKEDTDTQTGKFGLGSKSPFAYTDSFSVVSIKYGKKNYYTAVLDEDGIPTIHHLHEEITDEPNGVEVSFPVRKEDLPSFQNSAKRVAIGFDVKPNVTNQSDFVWETDYSEILRNGLYVKMGCVVYPVETQIIYEKIDETTAMFLRTCERTATIIEVPMGSVEISTSREALSYGRNEPTTETIIKKLGEYKKELGIFMQEFLDSMPTLHIAKGLFNAYYSDAMINRCVKEFKTNINDLKTFMLWKNSYPELTYKNMEVVKSGSNRGSKNYVSFARHNDIRVSDLGNEKKMPKTTPTNNIPIEYSSKVVLYIRDAKYQTKKKGDAARRELNRKINLAREKSKHETQNIYVELFGSISDKIQFFSEFDENDYVEGIDYEIVLVDEIEIPPPVKRPSAVRRSLEERIKKTKFVTANNQRLWEFSDHKDNMFPENSSVEFMNDPESSVIIVTNKVGDTTSFYNSSRFNSHYEIKNKVNSMFESLEKYFDMPIIIVTYSVSKMYFDYYVNHVKFEDLDLVPFAEKMNEVKKEFADKEIDLTNIQAKFAFKNDGVRKNLCETEGIDKTKLFGRYISFVLDRKDVVCQYSTVDYDSAIAFEANVRQYYSPLKDKFDNKYAINKKAEIAKTIEQFENEIVIRYPLLEHCYRGYYGNSYTSKEISNMCEYIKLIDKER